jgi:hypothetical protein
VLSNKKGCFVLRKTEGVVGDPLTLLRIYTKSNRQVDVDQDFVWFDQVGFPKKTRTNFMVRMR